MNMCMRIDKHLKTFEISVVIGFKTLVDKMVIYVFFFSLLEYAGKLFLCNSRIHPYSVFIPILVRSFIKPCSGCNVCMVIFIINQISYCL